MSAKKKKKGFVCFRPRLLLGDAGHSTSNRKTKALRESGKIPRESWLLLFPLSLRRAPAGGWVGGEGRGFFFLSLSVWSSKVVKEEESSTLALPRQLRTASPGTHCHQTTPSTRSNGNHGNKRTKRKRRTTGDLQTSSSSIVQFSSLLPLPLVVVVLLIPLLLLQQL